MKKTVYMTCTAAVLLAACSKVAPEQVETLPENPGESVMAGEGLTTLTAMISTTKTTLDETSGKVGWDGDDEIAVVSSNGGIYRFILSDKTAGKFVISGAESAPDPLVAIYPYDKVKSLSGNTLTLTLPAVLKYEADAKSPVILFSKVGAVTEKSATLSFDHLTAVAKFTFTHIPAYAAGFVVASDTRQISGDLTLDVSADAPFLTPGEGSSSVVFTFGYKTGYDGAVSFYATIPAASYAAKDLKFFLIDGDGHRHAVAGKSFDEDRIVGSGRYMDAKTIAAGALLTGAVVEYDKTKLNPGYRRIAKNKWALGNLVAEKDKTGEGFRSGWRIAETPEYYLSSLSGNAFDHFNWGGLARAARFSSAGFMTPAAGTEIHGKIYKDASGSAEASESDDLDFDTFGSTNPGYYGDVAFWASKGQYRLPSVDEISSLYVTKSGQDGKVVDVQFGSYNGKKAVYFTTTLSGTVV
ncbi:MAG: hypothetical protein IJ721_02150 [Bacteroidales bacterium]|nr:hypothetical protein [Bacteroidales bacterium]